MKYIDLHQDIVLSFYSHEKPFFDFTEEEIFDTRNPFDAGGGKAYKNCDIVFGAIRPFRCEGKYTDENVSIIYDHAFLGEYLQRYKRNFQDRIIYDKNDLGRDGLQVLLHIEGYDGCRSVDDIVFLYDMGVRSIGFVWNFDNNLAHCAMSGSDAGLTSLGYDCLDCIQEKGMIVDTAHMSHQAMMDTIQYTKKPLINSHSNSFSVYAHPRNVQDEFLRSLAKNGGCIGLNIYGKFLDGSKQASFEVFCDHIDYIRNLIGDEHIALGTDFHGIPRDKAIKGIQHVSHIEILYAMICEKYGNTFADKFFYHNAKRVLSHIL